MPTIRVVTLAEWVYERAYRKAINDGLDVANGLSQPLATEAEEFIRVTPDEIIVGVNHITVDELAVEYAHYLISQVDIHTMGTYTVGNKQQII